MVVPLCETEEERQEAFTFAQSVALRKRPDVLVAVPKPLGALLGLVQECQRWQWISQNVPELNNDNYAAEEVSRQMAASRQVLAYLSHDPEGLSEFITAARRLIFLKGNNSHDYKFSSAVLEDYQHLSPGWRERFLAASVFNLRGSGDKDNELVKRTRAALSA